MTNYPATHDIESYCVGHKEFVSSVAFFEREKFLISVSGDKTLRLWNYKVGKQLQSIELDFVPIKVVSIEGYLAISSENNTLHIFSYEFTSQESLKIHSMGKKTFEAETEFTAHRNTFYVKHIQQVDDDTKLLIEKAIIADGCAIFELHSDVTADLKLKLDKTFAIFKTFEISLLFKKKFDNVKQYIDRKKARIEGKESKRK